MVRVQKKKTDCDRDLIVIYDGSHDILRVIDSTGHAVCGVTSIEVHMGLGQITTATITIETRQVRAQSAYSGDAPDT